MTGGTLFSGIGAPEVAMPWVEWKWCAEIEPFAASVLAARFGHKNLGDVAKCRWRDVEPVDLLVAGTPCQSFSVAGLRRGLDDHRGNLTLELCYAISVLRPRILVWENVPGVRSDRGNAFGCFLAALVGADAPIVPPAGLKWTSAGLVDGPEGTAAWRQLDAQYFGLAQRRKRMFLVYSPRGSGIDPSEVLLERESVRRDSPPSRKTRKEVAGTLGGSSQSGGFRATDLDNSGAFIAHGVAHPLRSEGADATEDGTGRGTPLVPYDVARALNDHGAVGTIQEDVDTLIPFSAQQLTHPENRATARPSDPCPTLAGKGFAHVAEVADPISHSEGRTYTHEGKNNFRLHNVVRATTGVRRLTPRECERLQGFPDDWTLIDFQGKTASDSRRYRAIGNAMAVNVMNWIGRRIHDKAVPVRIDEDQDGAGAWSACRISSL